MDKIEVTETTHVDKADAWDAVAKARAEGFAVGHKAGMIEAAGIAEKQCVRIERLTMYPAFGLNSQAEALKDIAAAILAAAEEK